MLYTSLYAHDTSSDGLVFFPSGSHNVSTQESRPGNKGKLEQPQDTRGRIYDFIRMHPGIHVREISRELGVAMGDLQYHLYGLEKQGRIKTLRRGLYKFIFATEIFGERQSVILSILSQETPRELLLHLIERPNSSQKDLAMFTKLSQPTINWHMKRLVDLGIIARERRGKIVKYSVLAPINELRRFLQNYHPTVWEKWSSRLADMFLVISEGDTKVEEEGETG